MKWIVLLVLLAALALLGWVRLAPDDATRWHVLPEEVESADMDGGVMRRVEGDLAALDEIIRAEPRTEVLAGSVAEGMITYITRSRVFGFPDYTTIAQRGEDIAIHARLRYGKSDMGVNRARVERWLAILRQR
ncbi:DUF1499 domain-containing protein [Roseovarius aquimarinus]|uniref:DUF1499 domain-containing protein n=1 Tax=Roseovarius aquimarinus TaxID=1229156 RepID=A0ABW7I313_9RHOB